MYSRDPYVPVAERQMQEAPPPHAALAPLLLNVATPPLTEQPDV